MVEKVWTPVLFDAEPVTSGMTGINKTDMSLITQSISKASQRKENEYIYHVPWLLWALISSTVNKPIYILDDL